MRPVDALAEHARGRACAAPPAEAPFLREFRDVVFEDVVFDNNSSVTPY